VKASDGGQSMNGHGLRARDPFDVNRFFGRVYFLCVPPRHAEQRTWATLQNHSVCILYVLLYGFQMLLFSLH
jgi:hypothetical protein